MKTEQSVSSTGDPFREASERISAENDLKYYEEKNYAEHFEPLTEDEIRLRAELIKRSGDDMRRRNARERIIMQPRWREYKKQYEAYVFGRREALPAIPSYNETKRVKT